MSAGPAQGSHPAPQPPSGPLAQLWVRTPWGSLSTRLPRTTGSSRDRGRCLPGSRCGVPGLPRRLVCSCCPLPPAPRPKLHTLSASSSGLPFAPPCEGESVHTGLNSGVSQWTPQGVRCMRACSSRGQHHLVGPPPSPDCVGAADASASGGVGPLSSPSGALFLMPWPWRLQGGQCVSFSAFGTGPPWAGKNQRVLPSWAGAGRGALPGGVCPVCFGMAHGTASTGGHACAVGGVGVMGPQGDGGGVVQRDRDAALTTGQAAVCLGHRATWATGPPGPVLSRCPAGGPGHLPGPAPGPPGPPSTRPEHRPPQAAPCAQRVAGTACSLFPTLPCPCTGARPPFSPEGAFPAFAEPGGDGEAGRHREVGESPTGCRTAPTGMHLPGEASRGRRGAPTCPAARPGRRQATWKKALRGACFLISVSSLRVRCAPGRSRCPGVVCREWRALGARRKLWSPSLPSRERAVPWAPDSCVTLVPLGRSAWPGPGVAAVLVPCGRAPWDPAALRGPPWRASAHPAGPLPRVLGPQA